MTSLSLKLAKLFLFPVLVRHPIEMLFLALAYTQNFRMVRFKSEGIEEALDALNLASHECYVVQTVATIPGLYTGTPALHGRHQDF